MAEVILKYATQLRGRDDRVYGVQACGRERADHTWEGWLEFTPLDGSQPVVSERETTQPNRDDLEYWATGLTDPYLDGALLRATTQPKTPPPPPPAGQPASDAPAPHVPPAPAPATSAATPAAVLDPYHVYGEGDEILRGQLHALNATQLRNIVRAYHMSDESVEQLERMSEPELIRIIMHAVAEKAGK
jgi:hypothetical protein